MSNPTPTIRVNVDVTNPGQFFACCGLLELADRLWPGAEGWFEGREFCVTSSGTLQELIMILANAEVTSSLRDAELKRLGTLMSLEKTKLTEESLAEKKRLAQAWKEEILKISPPFNLLLDWWRDTKGNRTDLKTWAAKEMVLNKLRPLVPFFGHLDGDKALISRILSIEGEVDCVPFFFDSSATGQATARDAGFSLYDLRDVIGEGGAICPATEFLAFIGLQRCQPMPVPRDRYIYSTWTMPVDPSILAVFSCGIIHHPGGRRFAFSLIDRTKYMKAFSESKPLIGDFS